MNKTTALTKNFDTGNFIIGASFPKQMLWYLTDVIFFRSKIIPFSSILVNLLRLYGARIGKDVRIKPGLYVRYPWKLAIGDHSWIADCYIDNLDHVTIEDNCCLSQQAILITGNHNYKKPTFDLITKPITLQSGAWIGANATVAPGVTVGSHAILSIGSVALKDLSPYEVYQGNPAVSVRKRVID